MNYQALVDELAKAEYEELDDQAAADALNAATVVVRRAVPTRDIFIAAMRNGLILALRTVTLDSEQPAALRALAQTALDLTDQSVLDSVDMDDPASVALLGALEQYGLLSKEQAQMFAAMGDASISRVEQLGLGTVTAGDVGRARKWVG